MGLFNFLRTQLLGVDLEEVQRTSDRSDAITRQLNEADYNLRWTVGSVDYEYYEDSLPRDAEYVVPRIQERGADPQQVYAEVLAHEDDPFYSYNLDVEAEVDKEFQTELSAQAAGIRRTVAAPFKLVPSFLKIVPWQVWLLLAGVVFFWLGGHVWVAGKLKGRLAR